ncbi:MAG: choice-of-anchor B family protein [Rhodothermales bacterium]|nr:choice-of-anchor B family protein [Rhodothermales bacterium]
MQMQNLTRSLLMGLLLVLAGTANAQSFGGAVALTGDQLLISRSSSGSDMGTVFVFERGADGMWTEGESFSAPDGAESDNFGRTLAATDDLLVVGATGANGTVGAGYIFERNADGAWELGWSGVPEGVDDGDYFGRSAAIDGDWVYIGSAGHRANSGAVFAFRKGDDGAWMSHSRIEQPTFRPNAYFSLAMAASNGNVVVSAPFVSGGQIHAYRYNEETDAFDYTGLLSGDEGLQSQALAVHGNWAFAGVPGANDGIGGVQSFWFDAFAGSWITRDMLMPYDGVGGALGTALAVDGNQLWAGAPGADEGKGAIYRFEIGVGAITGAFRTSLNDAYAASGGGATLAVSGDVAVAGAPSGGPSGLVYVLENDGMWRDVQILGSQSGMRAITGGEVQCEDNVAEGYDCDNIDLLSFLPVHEVGGGAGSGSGVKVNDIWGWTDEETGREYVLLGRIDGTSFIDITDAYNPVYLGNLPMTEGSTANTWRDVKVYMDHAYIVADGAGEHGVQVFDLTQLRDVDPAEAPLEFEETARYDGIASAHNIVINEETGYAFTVGNQMGGQTCGGGYHIINIQEPANPQFAGCWGHEGTGNAGTGYSHDAQCVVYRGPDTDYTGREICIGGNENSISIADLTDKSNPVGISSASYPNVAYTHQGWLSEDHRFLYVNDELDEIQGVEGTRTLVWDVSDLDEPVLVKEHMGNSASSDHNLYVQDNFMYQSNYASGLRILDISDPANPREVGFFDTTPGLSNGPGFSGSWSNYPYFPSGTIAVSSVGEGLFLLKKRQIDT